MIMEAEISQDLEGLDKLETQESQWCKFQFEVQQAQGTRKSLCFSSSLKADKTVVLA